MSNTTLTWSNPTEYVDGTPYTQADNAGYLIKIDNVADIAIPMGWATTFDIGTLAAYKALKAGSHTVTIAVVSKAGQASAYGPVVTFKIAVAPYHPTTITLV